MGTDAKKDENKNLDGQQQDRLLARAQTRSEFDDRERLQSVTAHIAHAYLLAHDNDANDDEDDDDIIIMQR